MIKAKHVRTVHLRLLLITVRAYSYSMVTNGDMDIWYTATRGYKEASLYLLPYTPCCNLPDNLFSQNLQRALVSAHLTSSVVPP